MRGTSLRSALAFLTIIPMPGRAQDRLGRAWFPAVGGLLGLAAGTADLGVAAVAPRPVAAVAAVATLAILTGGLHLDGLADAADGLLGGRNRAHRLEIMRDPRVGSFGVIAVGLALAGKIACLTSLAPRRALVALTAAGAISRWAMLGLVVASPSARPSGLGRAATGPGGGRDLLQGSAIAALTLILDWRRASVAAGVAALTAAGVGMLARRRLGGATGDVYGAAAELCELAALATFVVRA
ncbi:MAG TPA: adenosylcobinamide-GDP ribazoletransferase [Candidatus Dormibacteraeota bacterium]|nr:adenosylcobinamide-GDP ribazoletransferase [Candidatus Dormibacteraeota bacterium]